MYQPYPQNTQVPETLLDVLTVGATKKAIEKRSPRLSGSSTEFFKATPA
jgi:hypothetical protein